jgi:hypothetical protein
MAGFRTTAANLGALLHPGVAADLLAGFRATLADLRTCLAGDRVQVRTAQHEIRAGFADIRTVQEHPDKFRRGMLVALLQTVLNGLGAQIVTFLTVVQALIHLLAQVFMYVWHLISFSLCVVFLLQNLAFCQAPIR